MKNILKITFALILSITFFACSEDNEKNETENQSNEFDSSVIILNKSGRTKGRSTESNLEALTIEIINFNKDFILNEAYKIEDIEFNDNGLFNDLVSGDGIYTSVELFDIKEESLQIGDKLSYGKDFKYMNDLKGFLKSRYSNKRGPGISVSCDIVTRPCPQTTWYNTCYFSDECTCVYLENCTAEISIEL